MTIYGYIQKLRLEEANLLLRKEMLSIGEIARRVGYRHQGHFSKLFFETYGVYPRELLHRRR
jgi:AraC-like DNA-binding protein